jgi:hypothetical protein
MRSPLPLTLLRGWALVGVWLVYGGFVYGSYHYALARGGLPYTLWPQWPVLYLGLFLVLSGLFALAVVNLRRLRVRPHVAVTLGLVYVVLMSGGLVVVQLIVACASGDCL